MGCCGERSDRVRPEGKWPGCILCKIWTILTTEKTPDGEPCVVIPGHIARKPDPCIYDQFLLMQLGKPVTWDNPDIRIFLGGVEQYTYDLTVGTEYDVEVTVHNASRDKPANQTSVDIHWIEFGAGGQTTHPIAVNSTDVPIWPGTSVVTTKWRTPDTPGHYCIEVELAHPNDGNPSNNRGWNNTQVHAAQSPVTRDMRIFNRYPRDCPKVVEGGGPWLRPHRVFLGWGPLAAVATLPLVHDMAHGMSMAGYGFLKMVAGYLIGSAIGLFAESIYAWIKRSGNEARGRDAKPPPTDCHLVEIKVDSYEFEDKIGKDFEPKDAFKDRPAIWNATVDPPSFVFLPGEAFRDVQLHVDAPDDPGPAGKFNVSVWQGGVPSGGVTFTITTEAEMAGCDTSPHNDLYYSGERRVIGWVAGSAIAVAIAAFLEAAGIAGLTGGGIAIVGLAIAVAAAAGAVVGFFIGFAVNWFDRLHVQDPKTITMTGCILCAGKNKGIPPFNDNDWTFNLGGMLALTSPIIAGLGVEQIRTRSAPGAGEVQKITDPNTGQQILHTEIGSHIGDYAAVGAAVGSVAGIVAGAAVGAVICGALGLFTFGIGAALCLLVVAIAMLVGAAAGGVVGDAIGGVTGWIADEVSDFNEIGESVSRGCIMSLTGRWITDGSHGHNEIHDVDSAQIIECNDCQNDPTGSTAGGLVAAVGIGRHPTGRDP